MRLLNNSRRIPAQRRPPPRGGAGQRDGH